MGAPPNAAEIYFEILNVKKDCWEKKQNDTSPIIINSPAYNLDTKNVLSMYEVDEALPGAKIS